MNGGSGILMLATFSETSHELCSNYVYGKFV